MELKHIRQSVSHGGFSLTPGFSQVNFQLENVG
jgi:hypothetical protein